MARNRDTNRSVLANAAFSALVALAVVALMLTLSHTGPVTLVWGLALIVGTLVALVALLLLEPQRDLEVPSSATSPCGTCGKPTLEEWRLCPYCGQMLECGVPLPMREERLSG